MHVHTHDVIDITPGDQSMVNVILSDCGPRLRCLCPDAWSRSFTECRTHNLASVQTGSTTWQSRGRNLEPVYNRVSGIKPGSHCWKQRLPAVCVAKSFPSRSLPRRRKSAAVASAMTSARQGPSGLQVWRVRTLACWYSDCQQRLDRSLTQRATSRSAYMFQIWSAT